MHRSVVPAKAGPMTTVARNRERGGHRSRLSAGSSLGRDDESVVLIQLRIARTKRAALVALEDFGDLRMPDWGAGIIGQKILLRHIGDVLGLGVLREQVIERLILAWAHLGRDRSEEHTSELQSLRH